jgi:uncharacterized protein (DUF1778 family)
METKPKKKIGRPLKNPGEPRTASLTLRVTPREKATIVQAAELEGVSVVQFICSTAALRIARAKALTPE